MSNGWRIKAIFGRIRARNEIPALLLAGPNDSLLLRPGSASTPSLFFSRCRVLIAEAQIAIAISRRRASVDFRFIQQLRVPARSKKHTDGPATTSAFRHQASVQTIEPERMLGRACHQWQSPAVVAMVVLNRTTKERLDSVLLATS